MSIDYGDNFSEDEFYCKCGLCDYPGVSQELLDRLNLARDYAGCAFTITSGHRCKDHNRDIGGSRTSSHLNGYAADIHCVNSNKRFKIIEACINYFDRVGIADTFIHVDVDPKKPREVIWTY